MAKKAEEQAIKDWFSAPQPDGFWVNYPTDLCSIGNTVSARWKGHKGECLKALLKLAPDEAERKRILANLKAQVKHDRDALKRGEKVYRWAYASTYVNNWRFDDEIDSVADLKPVVDVGICAYQDCGEPCHGEKFKFCTDHEAEQGDRWKAERMRAAKELLYEAGGDNSKAAVIERAKKWVKSHRMPNKEMDR